MMCLAEWNEGIYIHKNDVIIFFNYWITLNFHGKFKKNIANGSIGVARKDNGIIKN